MRKTRKIAILVQLLLAVTVSAFAAEPGITVSARQRYPWNGLVDLNFTITGTSGAKYDTFFRAKDMVGDTNIAMRTIYKADGTAATNATAVQAPHEQLVPGSYSWVWDMAADLNVEGVTYDGFISTNSAVLFRNRTLAAATRISVVFGGKSIPHVARDPSIVKADGAGKALQFQHNDGTWLKCVCVHLEQSGSDVTGYVKWARYMPGAYDRGTDFDGKSYSTMQVATSNEVGGYGIASLSLAYPNSRAGWHSDRVTVTGTANGTYSVKFNANGGSGTMSNEPYTYGTAKALMPNAFTRTGYTFQGWATSASGSKVYNDKQLVTNLTATAGGVVNLYAVWKSPLYMVIDLSSGANSSSYPVSYLDAVPSGGWSDTCKTTKLVLRRIEPGTYKMQNTTNVTLTKAFFCGVFEVTQKQYTLVMGSNPSVEKGDKRPVHNVSYKEIRGATNGVKWPASAAVDPTSFMGKLRARTELDFDLPTDAQWEYVCRAGTTSDFNNGGNGYDDMKMLGRFEGNTSDGKGGFGKHTTVGSYLANAWGLYDMHGNVSEWCLDKYTDYPLDYLPSDGEDPKGPTSFTSSYDGWVTRGGDWESSYGNCRSTSRSNGCYGNSYWLYRHGFRLCVTL